jgi:hypothetical protein
MARFINPRPQYRPNSKLFFFKSGTDTQLVTYKDQFETTGLENTHPVLTDSAGVVPNIFFSGSAKLVIQDENSVQYGEFNPVGGEKELGDFTLWDTVVTYDKNDIVEGSDGNFYQSLSNGNIGNDPTLIPTAWKEIRFIGVWNTNVTYSVGDIVQTASGNLWKALTATAGNDPDIDDGTNWVIAVNIPPDLWVTKTADFNIESGVIYQIDASGGTVDAALAKTYEAGQTITVHNNATSTNLVRMTNTALTINGAGKTITTSDNIVLQPGNTAKIAMSTTTTGDFV